jgi:hypothetical protein
MIELVRSIPHHFQRLKNRQHLRTISAQGRPVALFLVPEAGLVPYLTSHAILAKTLSNAGAASVVLSCRGLLPICSWKSARRMDPTVPGHKANAAYISCRQSADLASSQYGLFDVSIESLLDRSALAEVTKMLAEHKNDLSKLTHDGIEFGTLAIGEVLRHRRMTDPSDFGPGELKLVHAMLFSSLAVYFALKVFCSRFNLRRIAYFGDYAFWIGAEIFASRNEILVTRVNHLYNLDFDRRFIGLLPTCANAYLLDQIEQWPQFRDGPISPLYVDKIVEGALFRLKNHGGVSTHSPQWQPLAKDLREELGLSGVRKTLVAYTSSLDELVASKAIMKALNRQYDQGPKPFANQEEWLRALIEWIGNRSDCQLVIRFHPRLASGRQLPSSEYARLRALLSNHPANVCVIWPTDRCSSYNLAEIADAALVAWSTLGLELARFGVPVVAAFSRIGSFPTGGFIGFEETRDRYFAAVDEALRSSAELSKITESFRWTYYHFWSPYVDVSDIVPARDYEGLPLWRSPKNRDSILRALLDNESVSGINIERMARQDHADELEHQAMLRAIQKIIDFFSSNNAGSDLQASSPLVSRLRSMSAQQEGRHGSIVPAASA